MASPSKRVLITGIEGFTGRHLARHLRIHGYEVVGTALQPMGETGVLQCDLRDPEQVGHAVESLSPDYVIHLAGIAFVGAKDPRPFYDVNTLASEHLLEALSRAPRLPEKILLASSAVVYGPQGTSVLEESLCPNPNNHYGLSKYAMEQVARGYFDRLPILLPRLFNYTGPGQEERFVIPKIVAHFRRKASKIEMGNLDVQREFNDVRYVCECYRRLMECDAAGEVVNLCSGQAVALRNVLEMMEQMTGHFMEVRVNPAYVRKNEIPLLIGSTSKLDRLIRRPEAFQISETLNWMLESQE